MNNVALLQIHILHFPSLVNPRLVQRQVETSRGKVKPGPGESRLPEWHSLPACRLGAQDPQEGEGWSQGASGGPGLTGEEFYRPGLCTAELSNRCCQRSGEKNVFSHVLPGPAFTTCKCMQIMCKHSLWLE